MKKYVHFIVIFSFVSIEAFSQNASFGLQAGIASNSMKGLKHINEHIKNDLPFDAKTVSDFPPYLFYRPYIGIHYSDNISCGIFYSFLTTGSRVSAVDYSGEYRFDMIINSSGPGIFYEVNLMTDRAVHLSLYSIFGVSFSKLKMNESLTLMDSLITHDSYTFMANSFYLEPGINFMYPIKNIGVGINLSYSIGLINKPFHLSDNEYTYLSDPDNGEKIKPQWNGLRIGLTISYSFNLNTSSFAGL
jgi:hypothetical protein